MPVVCGRCNSRLWNVARVRQKGGGRRKGVVAESVGDGLSVMSGDDLNEMPWEIGEESLVPDVAKVEEVAGEQQMTALGMMKARLAGSKKYGKAVGKVVDENAGPAYHDMEEAPMEDFSQVGGRGRKKK